MQNEPYHLVPTKDLKADTADITKLFSEMAAGRLSYDLNLINYYDEVPITYGSTIISVDEDSVEMAVHEHQALVIKHNNSTMIQCKHFRKGWMSTVMPPLSILKKRPLSCTTSPMPRFGRRAGRRFGSKCTRPCR